MNCKQKDGLAELAKSAPPSLRSAPTSCVHHADDLPRFGADRSITLCRELTKLHEDIWKTTSARRWSTTRPNELRGEYVLVMAGAPETVGPGAGADVEQAAQRALELTGQGFGPTAAAKAAAQGTPYSKSLAYKQLLVLQQPAGW